MYLKISTYFLNLYNFNGLEPIDRVLLIIGVPLAFLWLGVGIGMVRYIHLASSMISFFDI